MSQLLAKERLPVKRTLTIAVIILLSWVLTSQIAEYLLTLMYEDKALDSLNRLLTNKNMNPLQHYIDRMRPPIAAFHILLSVIAAMFVTRVWRSPVLLLFLLIVGDIVLLFFSTNYSIWLLNVDIDWSIPEMYQYFKEAMIGLVLVVLYRRTDEPLYIVFAVLALFMLIDDSMKYHESVGHILAPLIATTPLPATLKIAPNYIGEILSLAPLSLIVPFGAWYFLKAKTSARRFALNFVLLLALLIVFGIVFDFLVHSGLNTSYRFRLFMAHLEDFGEMIVMSMILTFVVAAYWRMPSSIRADNL